MNLVNEFIECFKTVPAELDKMREILLSRQFTKEELAKMAIECTDLCFGEYSDALSPELDNFGIDDMSSLYIVDTIKMLLESGLDPNIIIDNENALWNTTGMDAPNIGATVLRLLLENGGNPNLRLYDEHLFEYTSFDPIYEITHDNYFHVFQCWILLMAYGGCWENGEIPIKMLNGNTVDIFKNFELFDFSIASVTKPNEHNSWIMHIFNIETKEKVAEY